MTDGPMTDKADEGTLLNCPDVLIGIKLTLVRPEMEVRPQAVVMMTAIIRTVLMVTDVEDGVGDRAVRDIGATHPRMTMVTGLTMEVHRRTITP